MEHEFPGEQWFRAWERAAAANAAWVRPDPEPLAVLVVVRADDRLPSDHHYRVTIAGDELADWRPVDGPGRAEYDIAFTGDYADWVRLLEGEIGVAGGLMDGAFEIEPRAERGSTSAHPRSIAALVDSARDVDTDFRY